ncbi:ABC-type transport auxiliary lipoprotein family protein [Sphingobium yanoikuyae]|uniref:ABC-type transport auxiliary lipoprotein family protein n=1 Tax=Sphingobium yanoikuyae TaxID=13690 RepID=UPI003B8F25C7
MLDSGKPDNLFRFGVPDAEKLQGVAGTGARTLALARIRFAPEIEGDRIMTAHGDTVLYVKDARWAAPAPDLYTQALLRQYRSRAPDLYLAPPRERPGQRTGSVLRLEIDRFEARYGGQAGKGSAPIVLVSGVATLTNPARVEEIVSQRFSAQEPATANGKAAIVEAFDRAVARQTGDLVDWSLKAVAEFENPEGGQ